MTTDTEILSCGHPRTPNASPGTGCAIMPDDRTLCYSCADDATRAEIAAAVKPGTPAPVLYWSSDGKTITTWSGGFVMNRVVEGARHPWSSDRYYLTAIDANGRKWYGTGAKGMYAVLRLAKA